MVKSSILVTGGAGYIGSVLTQRLLAQGFRVTVLDNGIMAPGSGRELLTDGVTFVQGDICDSGELTTLLRKGIDGVVHLASIVGDPACSVDPDLAWETNYLGTIHLAEACRQVGIHQLVFASTCSNYGYQTDGEVNEWTPLNPQSIYARTKVMAEHYLLSVRSAAFQPWILRFATVYGLSPRMRFDLAVNSMTIKAILQREVMVQGGDQWRPFVHVTDAAQAIIRALTMATSTSIPEIYNCGSNSENYRLRDLGELIVREVRDARLSIASTAIDRRIYRVSFDRIRDELGFFPRYRLVDGIREIYAAVRNGFYHDFAQAQYSNYMLICDRAQHMAVVVDPDHLMHAT